MVEETLSEAQLANRRKMEKQYKKSAKAHSNDRRFLIAAFLLSLLVKQSIDLVFASESTRVLIQDWANKAANHAESGLDELMRVATECESTGSNGPLCVMCTRFKHWNEVSGAQRLVNVPAGGHEGEYDDSGTIHVVENTNMTRILKESAEGNEFVATIVKTHQELRHVEGRDLSKEAENKEPKSSTTQQQQPQQQAEAAPRRFYKHPLLERIVHSLLFIQFILPLITALGAAALINYLPSSNNTVVMSFFLLFTYIIGRICLLLY